jgi:hypothetical protein
VNDPETPNLLEQALAPLLLEQLDDRTRRIFDEMWAETLAIEAELETAENAA